VVVLSSLGSWFRVGDFNIFHCAVNKSHLVFTLFCCLPTDRQAPTELAAVITRSWAFYLCSLTVADKALLRPLRRLVLSDYRIIYQQYSSIDGHQSRLDNAIP